VIIDPKKAKGRKEIVNSCPYGAIYYNDEADVAQKCTGCVHLLEDGWTETRCSQVCPTEAIKLILADDAEMAKLAKSEGLEVYREDLGTKPRVYYKNLYRWEKVFVSASVAYKDTDECAEGAKVTVSVAGKKAAEGTVNNYGEFVVDELEPGAQCEVLIEAPGYKPYSAKAKLEESTNLGQVFLDKA